MNNSNTLKSGISANFIHALDATINNDISLLYTENFNCQGVTTGRWSSLKPMYTGKIQKHLMLVLVYGASPNEMARKYGWRQVKLAQKKMGIRSKHVISMCGPVG